MATGSNGAAETSGEVSEVDQRISDMIQREIAKALADRATSPPTSLPLSSGTTVSGELGSVVRSST